MTTHSTIVAFLAFAAGAATSWLVFRSSSQEKKKTVTVETTEKREEKSLPNGEMKMVFLVRQDLGMSKGKIAAQV